MDGSGSLTQTRMGWPGGMGRPWWHRNVWQKPSRWRARKSTRHIGPDVQSGPMQPRCSSFPSAVRVNRDRERYARGVTGPDGPETPEVPTAFVAVALIVYLAPLASPLTSQDPDVPVTVHDPASCEAIVYADTV